MAVYVPNCDCDIFISYAHEDNKPILPAELGWVDQFEDNLKKFLGRRALHPGNFSLWIDQKKLRGNHEPEQHIPECVSKSAVFVAILSPNYIRSAFCQLELKAFVESLGGKGLERLFVVNYFPINENRQEIPEFLRKLRQYRFWKLDKREKPQTFAYPMPDPQIKEKEYLSLLDELADDILEKLEELRGPAEKKSFAKPQAGQPTVLLAEVIEDLEPRRDDIRRYLKDEGIEVLPSGTYPTAHSEFEQAFLTDISKCAAFVQLLGSVAGARPPDVPDGFGWLQFELAKSVLPPDRILQWRSPNLDLSEVALPLQRRLLESGAVQARPIQGFKESIVRTARTPPPVKKDDSPGTEPLFFINCAAADVAQAEAIREAIHQNFGEQVSSLLRVDSGNEKAAEKDELLTNFVIQCDGMLIVYGSIDSDWVDIQVLKYLRHAEARNKKIKLFAVVEGPPDPKAPLSLRQKGLRTIRIDNVVDAIRPVVT